MLYIIYDLSGQVLLQMEDQNLKIHSKLQQVAANECPIIRWTALESRCYRMLFENIRNAALISQILELVTY